MKWKKPAINYNSILESLNSFIDSLKSSSKRSFPVLTKESLNYTEYGEIMTVNSPFKLKDKLLKSS